MNRRIGIVARNVGTGMGIQSAYFDYFQEYGDVVIINPVSMAVNENIHLLVLPGGPDILDGVPSTETGRPDVFLEFFDKEVLWKYIKLTDIPILGICRGFQTLNRYFGGSITQHVINGYSIPRNKLIEEVSLNDGTIIKVNSLHHQAIYIDQLADILQCEGVSKEFENVEIFSHPDRHLLGVQFHPEEFRPHLVNSFISSCTGNN